MLERLVEGATGSGKDICALRDRKSSLVSILAYSAEETSSRLSCI